MRCPMRRNRGAKAKSKVMRRDMKTAYGTSLGIDTVTDPLSPIWREYAKTAPLTARAQPRSAYAPPGRLAPGSQDHSASQSPFPDTERATFNRWPASYWNCWPASSESAHVLARAVEIEKSAQEYD